MKFFSKNLWQILEIILIILLAGLSFYLYYSYNKKVNSLQRENAVLSQKYSKSEQESKLKDTQLDEKNKEIETLKQANNNRIREDVESDKAKSEAGSATENENEGTTSSKSSSSIYDKINGSDDFKNKITSALDLMRAQDGDHFQMAATQVGSINENDDYGGKQKKRDIYIGADNNPAITGSLITHEAQHIYNVYVEGIWSYGTKEQELPCYEAELVTAQRLGAPSFFITSIEESINYWQAQN